MLFKPKCPVDAEEWEWLLAGFKWLAREFPEREEESIETRVSALSRDRLDLLLGLGQSSLRKLQSSVANFVTRCAANVLGERLVQAAPRHAGDTGYVIHAKGIGEMLRNVVERSRNSGVV